MDKKARQLLDDLLALKAKAEKLAEDQRAVGDQIQEAIDHYQRWAERQQPADKKKRADD
jgi:hypothetical protein